MTELATRPEITEETTPAEVDRVVPQTRELSGAQLVIELLERQGVTCIAGVPGGANLPMYDALSYSSIAHVLARHEQGAGFIAQGMARVTGRHRFVLQAPAPGRRTC